MDTRRACIAALVAAACAAPLLLMPLGSSAAAAQAVYKCPGRNGVIYTQVPCSRQVVTPRRPRPSSRAKPPPQNRAKAMNRARLTPQARAECSALDATLREQSARVKAQGEAVTADDERPLVQARLRYHALRC